MAKPVWLKTTIMKYNITKILFYIFTFFEKNKTLEKKEILITQLDGLGDGIIRLELLRILSEKYGKENIVILTKNCYEILQLEGYTVIKCKNLFHLNIFKLLGVYRELRKYNFKELYLMEFNKDKEVDFLKKFNYDIVYMYRNNGLKNWERKFSLKLITKSDGKIIESVYNFAKEVDKNVKKENLKPVLHIETKNMDYIAVGIGAGGDYKVASPETLAEFLMYIISVQPDTKFHILGNGKNQEKYYQKLNEIIKSENIINFVDKLTVIESAKQIANAKLYIGFDSGLYNIAYALDKKILAVVSMKNSQSCYHDYKNIEFVYRRKNDKPVRKINDKVYVNEELNQIPTERFIEKYNLLK
jgi:ADP-heptose:LPS heptosyltransferase